MHRSQNAEPRNPDRPVSLVERRSPTAGDDAIALLQAELRDIEGLFQLLEQAADVDRRRQLFERIADRLAIRAHLEERHFYPAVKEKRTKDAVLSSLHEHLGIKRILAELWTTAPDHPRFEATMKVLRQQVKHHAHEEETDLFPTVRAILPTPELVAIADELRRERAIYQSAAAPLAGPDELANARRRREAPTSPPACETRDPLPHALRATATMR
jgi:hypothetical protein